MRQTETSLRVAVRDTQPVGNEQCNQGGEPEMAARKKASKKKARRKKAGGKKATRKKARRKKR